MNKHRAAVALIGGICALALSAAATPASASVAFLSHTGSGSTCSQSAPCAGMPTAVSVAGPNGEVICLDKGFYGGVGITAPVTIEIG